MSSALRHRAQLSQNFLTDPRLVASLLDRIHLGGDGPVYEIGPGTGIITVELARRFRRVVAIEKDAHLAAELRRRFRACPQVSIYAGDFLRYHLPSQQYTVVANIPFNITSAIVAKLTEARHTPDVAYLIMQSEAANMFAGCPRESLRTVLLKPWFEVEIVHRFRRSDFVPAPRVDVVMLRLRKRGPPLVSQHDRQSYRDFTTYAYTHWRAAHRNPLSSIFTGRQLHEIERDLGHPILHSPSALTIADWLRLFDHAKTFADAQAVAHMAGSERRLVRQQSRLRKTHRTRVGKCKV